MRWIKQPQILRQFRAGERVYKPQPFVYEPGQLVHGKAMIDCAKRMGISFGEEEGKHLLLHGDKIPAVLQGILLVIPQWRKPGNTNIVACLMWQPVHPAHWMLNWYILGGGWGRELLLERVV